MSVTPSNPKRSDVLLALWKSAQWIEDFKNQMEQGKVTPSEKSRQLVYMTQVHAQVCKTALFALKDETLELRIMELEEKLKNGVLIPNGPK